MARHVTRAADARTADVRTGPGERRFTRWLTRRSNLPGHDASLTATVAGEGE